MRTRVCVFVFFVFMVSLLTAQDWSYDRVLRPSRIITWDQAVAYDDAGNSVVFCGRGKAELVLKMVSPTGSELWSRTLAYSISEKRSLSVVRTSDGNYIVGWNEIYSETNQHIKLAKISSGNIMMWGVMDAGQNTSLDNDESHFEYKMTADGVGGAYINYNLYVNGTFQCYCQQVSSWGTLLLPGNGIQLSNNDNSSWIVACQSAPGNSQIVCVRSNQDRFFHITGGTVEWTHILTEFATVSNPNYIDMTMCANSQLAIVYSGYASDERLMGIIRVDMQGSATQVLQTLNPYEDTYAVRADNESNLFVTSTFNLRKYSTQDSLLWQVTLFDNMEQNYIYPAIPDNAGGCYLLYRYFSDNASVYQQHVSNSGSPLWEPDTYAIPGIGYSYIGRLMGHAYNNYVVFTWKGQLTSMAGVYMQSRYADGMPYSADSVPVCAYTAGGARFTSITPRSNDIMVTWLDDRTYDVDGNLSLYYQYMQPTGITTLAPQGWVLSTSAFAGYYFPESVPVATTLMDNDNAAVFWWDYDSNNQLCLLKGQCIDNLGNALWEAGGRTFYTTDYLNTLNIHAYYADNALYIGWQDNYHIRVQKIVDGVAQWGEEGQSISIDNFAYYLTDFKAGFVVLDYYDTATSRTKLYVKCIQPDGTSAPGWMEGVSIPISDTYPYADWVKCSLMPDGRLAVVWTEVFNNTPTVKYDYLTPSQHVITPHVLFSSNAFYDYSMKVALDTSDGLAVAIYYPGADGYHLVCTKRDAQHGSPWGYGMQNVQAYPEDTLEQMTFTRFTNGGYALAKMTDDGYLYTNYLYSNGALQNTSTGLHVHENCTHIQTACLYNALYYVLTDNSFGSSNYDFAELRMLKYNNPITNTIDNPEVTAPFTFSAYPNPFSSSLSFYLSLPDRGKAEISIHNVKGQRVKTLTSGMLEQGIHRLLWDGKDEQGNITASGIYFVRMNSGKHTVNKKVIRY